MLSILDKMKIRTGSAVWAIQDIGEHYSNLSQTQYEDLIIRLTGVQVTTIDALDAEITFKYIVQSIICNDTKDILELVKDAVISSHKQIETHGNTMRLLRSPTKVVKEIQGVKITKIVTHRVGVSKREQAFGICNQNTSLDKSVLLDMLMVALEITKQNANIYHSKWTKSLVV